ncbi:MAG: CDP-glycerol glycerophosphotransferase family protein [Chlamydiales bacterium]|nr:CDP-glycerol glycerophosphotransferase family protein [Chlamydiales bacterium]
MDTLSRPVGLIHGPAQHYLDHIVPLCALLKAPLAVTDEEIAHLARTYYPMVDLILLNPHSFAFDLTREYDTLITTLPKPALRELFFLAERLLGKELRAVWCPHGNSDKGHASPFMEALSEEKSVFVYGQKMIDLLVQKGAYQQIEKLIRLGNYRREFSAKHRNFYAPLVEKEIFSSLNAKSRTILFAPTWQDAEDSSSFKAIMQLIEELPDKFNLIVKPHPNLRFQESLHVEKKPNLCILTDFPPIYPLLERVDIYLGDMSSIGYDFLSFDRPMFFFNKNKRDPQNDPGLYLFRCGTEIDPSANLYTQIEQGCARDALFSPARLATYTYCFDTRKPPAWRAEEEMDENGH